MIITILSIVAFLLSLPLRWYQNYWMGTDSFDRPLIMRSGFNQIFYLIVTFLLTYGGIAGIWYSFGIWAAIIAFAIRWWIGRTSWKVYFNRQVAQYADHYYREFVMAKSGVPEDQMDVMQRFSQHLVPDDVSSWDEDRLRREAYAKAYETVRFIRTKG